MGLGNRPNIEDREFIRVTKLADTAFIPTDYMGTLTENTRNGDEYTTYLFKVLILRGKHDLGKEIEFRATRRWYTQFNAWLTSERENLIEHKKIAMSYTISGFGRDISYIFDEVDLPEDHPYLKESKKNKK